MNLTNPRQFLNLETTNILGQMIFVVGDRPVQIAPSWEPLL